MAKLLVSCLVGLALVGSVVAQEIPDPCIDFTIFAWVDPNHGVDPMPPLTSAPDPNMETTLVQGLNDPTQPYKTLQQAIDAVYQAFRWDGEDYANPREIGDDADIGFDEFHLFIMAGSYANDTNSHNFPSPLNTSSTQGASTRFMLFPALPTVPPGSTVEVKGAWANPPTPYAAWDQPPGTLAAPRIKSDPLPEYFNTRYIAWNNPGPVTNNPASGRRSAFSRTKGPIAKRGGALRASQSIDSDSHHRSANWVDDAVDSKPVADRWTYE